VPDAGPQRERSANAARKADHAGIARLADELLPALIAKLGTTQLGEIEVREGEWHVRLRRPYGAVDGEGRRATDKPSRTQPGHEGHGHGRAAPEAHRSGRGGSGAGSGTGTGGGGSGSGGGATGITAGSGAASASTNGTGGARTGGGRDGGDGGVDRSRTIATSPAVGTFQAGPRAAAGTRVRAGDTLGSVNVLGVPQEVLSPVDGIVGSTLVEAGMAVEYGQELIRIELAAPAEAR
jgi:biotin carboxyl carrier protein